MRTLNFMEHKVTYLFTNKAKAIQWIIENNCWPRPFFHAFGYIQVSPIQPFLVLLWPTIDQKLLLWWSVFKLVCWVVKLPRWSFLPDQYAGSSGQEWLCPESGILRWFSLSPLACWNKKGNKTTQCRHKSVAGISVLCRPLAFHSCPRLFVQLSRQQVWAKFSFHAVSIPQKSLVPPIKSNPIT